MTSDQPQRKSLKSVLAALPRPYQGGLREQIKASVSNPKSKIPLLVILDDDPTGTQTCHDIYVLTVWDIPTLSTTFTSEVTKSAGGFFILTNSRALHPAEAEALIGEICKNLLDAAKSALGDERAFEIVLRSDSTLRGHFPLEADATEAALGRKVDAWILAPFFLQGGRYTIDNVHYVAEGDVLLPAAETPFAQDASFGYKNSDLRDWVVEKSKGVITRDQVKSLSLEDVREGGPDRACELLVEHAQTPGAVVIVNAAAEEDMDVVVLGLLKAAEQGKRFLYRSGAALVSSRLGIKPIPPKSSQSLHMDASVGGLIIAGSYVPKTTAQLKTLRVKSKDKLTTFVLGVHHLLKSPQDASEAVTEAVQVAEKEISRGQDVLIMTSRDLVTGRDERESLDIGGVVAKNLVSFLEQLKTRPRYLIAKGGITSSDMATKGLRMKCATVVGQAAPGVPLWECFEETSKWAGLPYIVFPGNVGSEETLFQVVDGWRSK